MTAYGLSFISVGNHDTMDIRGMGPIPFAWAGIAAVFVMVLAVCICLLGDPSWDYQTDSMCDFGVSDIKYVSAVFIGGCVLSGLLFVVSGFGWFLFEESKYVRAGGIVVMISGVALMCVGLLDKSFSFHQYVTITFAVIFIVAIELVSVQDIMDRHFILLIGLGIVGLFGLITIFVDIAPYSFVQVILTGYTFVWYLFKSVRYFDPKSQVVRKIAGMD